MQAIQHAYSQYLKDYAHDWKFNVMVGGAAASITCCVLAIFASAPFFALCFAALAGICLFAAFQIHQLGTFKTIADGFVATKQGLQHEISRLKEQISSIDSQLKIAQSINDKALAQLAAYEETFKENVAVMMELKALRHGLKEQNEVLEKRVDQLIEKSLKLASNLQQVTQYMEEFKGDLQQLIKELAETNEKSFAEKRAELQQLKDQINRLQGIKEGLETQVSKLEAQLNRMDTQNETYTGLNQQFATSLQKIVVHTSGKSFTGNPNSS